LEQLLQALPSSLVKYPREPEGQRLSVVEDIDIDILNIPG